MVEIEVAAHWAAVVAYVVASLIAGFGVCARLSRIQTIGVAVLGLGASAHTLALGLRWASTGHGPFLGRYEAFSSHALAIAVLYLVLQWWAPTLRAGAIVVAPLVFLLLGVGVLSPAAPTFPSPALRSPWLTIHVTVAKLALATAIASGTAGLVLLLDRHGILPIVVGLTKRAKWTNLEPLSHVLLGYAFFLMSVVLLSGSLWANAAWGSFWSWDPVETWSLAFWAGCAFVLHLRSTGWVGKRWARSILALTILGTVSFIGYGHFGVSIHAAYIAP